MTIINPVPLYPPQRWERMVYLDEFTQPTDEYYLQQKTSVEMNESITKTDEKIKA